jgi:alpha-galactosidase
MGVALQIETTTDRKESLRGADFVVTIALIDGARRLREGWDIAQKHGFRFPGSFHIMYDEPFWLNFYQLRLFDDISKDIIECCPEAWHLMVSNPVLAGTTYLQREYPRVKMVGLCHGFAQIYSIARLLGLEDEKLLTYEIPGVNHFVWCTHLNYKGENVFPMIDAWIEKESEKVWAKGGHVPLTRKTVDLYRKFGAIPVGDTSGWSGASWPWWYHSDAATEKKWAVDSRTPWYDYVKSVGNMPNRLKELAADKSAKMAETFQLVKDKMTGEPMIPIVDSVSCDIPRVIITNILNSSNFVPGIPNDFEVEIPCLVSRRGIQGIKTKGLPKALLAHILRDRVAPAEIEIEAYRTGSRELLTQLVLMDKWAPSEKAANALIDEIFALPYHRELAVHYK